MAASTQVRVVMDIDHTDPAHGGDKHKVRKKYVEVKPREHIYLVASNVPSTSEIEWGNSLLLIFIDFYWFLLVFIFIVITQNTPLYYSRTASLYLQTRLFLNHRPAHGTGLSLSNADNSVLRWY